MAKVEASCEGRISKMTPYNFGFYKAITALLFLATVLAFGVFEMFGILSAGPNTPQGFIPFPVAFLFTTCGLIGVETALSNLRGFTWKCSTCNGRFRHWRTLKQHWQESGHQT